MFFWFSSGENIYVSEVILEIETTKADISRIEFEINKLLEKDKLIKIAISQSEENLNFLKKDAIIISIREYKQSIFRTASLYQDKILINNEMLYLNKILQTHKEKLQKLEFKKEEVKFKLLEFKKR